LALRDILEGELDAGEHVEAFAAGSADRNQDRAYAVTNRHLRSVLATRTEPRSTLRHPRLEHDAVVHHLQLSEAVPLGTIARIEVRHRRMRSSRWSRQKANVVSSVELTMANGNYTSLAAGEPGADAAFVEFISALRAAVSRHQHVSSSDGIAAELERLAALRTNGVLDDRDWVRAKDLFLGKPPNDQQDAVRLLGNLFALKQKGVLSKSEFNTKKWEILSRSG